MPISLDRSICCDLNETISREWLITNGIGGYAAGTVAGVLTRVQHGLLVSPLSISEKPQLLLAKIDEEVLFDHRTYFLGTNEYQDGNINPNGFVHLESFRLEEGFPIFTYKLGGIDGILLEKRIWMPQGKNTTYIQYRALPASTREPTFGAKPSYLNNGRFYGYSEATQSHRALTLTLLPFSAYRYHSEPQHGDNDKHFKVHVHQSRPTSAEFNWNYYTVLPDGAAGCTIHAFEDAHPYHIMAVGHPDSQTTFIPTGVWYWRFLHRHDQIDGRQPVDDLYLPGVIRTKLWPGENTTLTIIVTAEDLTTQVLNLNQFNLSYQRSVEYQRSFFQPRRYFGEGGETSQSLHILPLMASDSLSSGEEFLHLLLQAGNRFRAHLPQKKLWRSGDPLSLFGEPGTLPVIYSDYFSMEHTSRDTFIALPGLTCATGQYDEGVNILRHFARYFKQGMLPDRLPTVDHPLSDDDYASVDTTLWYFYALDNYLRATNDYKILDELYPYLVESIEWYLRGTFLGIKVDYKDGLLQTGQSTKALTWMNTTIDGIPVTPRTGKPVEVNALWYYALSLMREWSERQLNAGQITHTPSYFEEWLTRCKESFQHRFWNAERNHLYDVVDGVDGDDTACRPNQLFAISLRYPVLDPPQRAAVFDCITSQLLTPFGLRTLAPQHEKYQGQVGENKTEELRALHQGCAWPWLLGPYIDAMLSLHNIDGPPFAGRSQATNLRQEFVWRKALQVLEPFSKVLQQGLLGMMGGVFEGNLPQRPCVGNRMVSALSTSEILRVYNLLTQVNIGRPLHAVLV